MPIFMPFSNQESIKSSLECAGGNDGGTLMAFNYIQASIHHIIRSEGDAGAASMWVACCDSLWQWQIGKSTMNLDY